MPDALVQVARHQLHHWLTIQLAQQIKNLV